LVYKRSDWEIADFDQLVKNPARAKQVFDENQIGGGRFLNSIKNSLNGLHFGFNIPSDQIKIIAAMHGSANVLNFDDYVWKKYRIGEWLKVEDPRTGQPAVRNPFFASKVAPELHYATQDPDDEKSLFPGQQYSGVTTQGSPVPVLSYRDGRAISLADQAVCTFPAARGNCEGPVGAHRTRRTRRGFHGFGHRIAAKRRPLFLHHRLSHLGKDA
jgi:hypothetical protein